MHYRRNTIVATIVAAAAILTATPALAAATPVNCGMVLTASITLKADLTCPGDAFIIGADGITVNLGKHVLHGSATGNAISVVSHHNTTVKNGTITGFSQSVQVRGANNLTLSRLDLHSGGDIFLNGAEVVDIDHSSLTSVSSVDADHLTVTHSSVANGGFFFPTGLYPTFTHDTFTNSSLNFGEVADAVVTDNKFVGSRIDIEISDFILVRHNRISGAPVGVFIGNTTDHVQVVDNQFEDNQVGVSVKVFNADQTAASVITGNTFRHNGAAGVLFQTTAAVCSDCPSVTANTFVDNGFSPAGLTDNLGNPVADGLHFAIPGGGTALLPTATPILVANNTTRHNASYGIFAPVGTVLDGGGNTSSHTPHDCLGVVCAP